MCFTILLILGGKYLAKETKNNVLLFYGEVCVLLNTFRCQTQTLNHFEFFRFFFFKFFFFNFFPIFFSNFFYIY